jgi:heat shock protein HslJ
MQLGPMTAAACDEESLAPEMGQMFGPAQSYVYEDDGDTVIFKFAAGGPWDYYRKAGSAGELTGVIWNLTELNGESLIPTTHITAEFSEDGRVSGSSGCNNYGAAFEVDGNNITINTSPAATTLMACPPPIMEQETAYLEALAAAKTFEFTEEELVLFDADGNPVTVFMAVSQELAGSSWDVISYNNGRGGVVNVIIDTEITANFGEEGELIGNAGCNDYFGPYESDGENISMGPFGTTRKLCQEPEGVMEQEAEYLAALETAATYKNDGLTMNMRTADGATVANFRRVLLSTVSGAVTNADDAAIPESYPSGKATIISLGGIEFFAEVPILDENLPDALKAQNAVVILRLRGNEHIGSTAIRWLERYNADLRDGGNLLLLAGIQPNLIEELEKAKVMDAIGRENVFEAQTGLGAAEDAALEAAQRWLSDQSPKQTVDDSG